jgi:hypothetical protein
MRPDPRFAVRVEGAAQPLGLRPANLRLVVGDARGAQFVCMHTPEPGGLAEGGEHALGGPNTYAPD